ncbi:LAETG motif-containing sortase-dependent surface protein [Kitasatospora sp. NPDC056181]|uniref:LAETG motif-containing sortase-dependent surface protein n=1 Tax=Kitasatospora sp. NPDC056181 TaxID=3345737 RepID=UPI0035DA028F
MNLRRVWASAATAVVLGSVALATAPAASATATTGPTATSSASPSASATSAAPASPAASGSPSAAAPTGSASPSASASASATKPPKGTPSAGASTGSASPSAGPSTPTSGATPSDLKTAFPSECKNWPVADKRPIDTSLPGLPSKLEAGSGWHEFTYRASNTTSQTLIQVDLDLHMGTDGLAVKDVSELLVTVEWYDSAAKQWKNAYRYDEWGFFATARTIKAGEYVEAKMRIKADAKAPTANGFFLTSGYSLSENGDCDFGHVNLFKFTVNAAGTPAGKPEDAKPTPVTPADAAALPGVTKAGKDVPRNERTQLPVAGRLAETGSSSATPVIAGVGAATLLAGTAAVVLLRRRKGGAAA